MAEHGDHHQDHSLHTTEAPDHHHTLPHDGDSHQHHGGHGAHSAGGKCPKCIFQPHWYICALQCTILHFNLWSQIDMIGMSLLTIETIFFSLLASVIHVKYLQIHKYYVVCRHDDDDVFPWWIQWDYPIWLLENLNSGRAYWLHDWLLPPGYSVWGAQVLQSVLIQPWNEVRLNIHLFLLTMDTILGQPPTPLWAPPL